MGTSVTATVRFTDQRLGGKSVPATEEPLNACKVVNGRNITVLLSASLTLSLYNITAVFMMTPHTTPSLLGMGRNHRLCSYCHGDAHRHWAVFPGWFKMVSSHSHNRQGRRNSGGFAPLDALALPPDLAVPCFSQRRLSLELHI